MLVIFSRPINRQADSPGTRRLIGQDLQAKPFHKILRLEPRIMNEPRKLFDRGFLIALSPCQFGLIAGLLFNDRQNEPGDGFYLMTVCSRHHLPDIICPTSSARHSNSQFGELRG